MIKLARPDGGEDLDNEEEDKNPDPVDLPPLEPPVPPPDEPHVPPSDSDSAEPVDPNAKVPISLSKDDVMEIDINILRPTLKTALKKSINLEVQPRHFGPTFASDQHFEATLKSQLTSVFH
ncbi:hypothetical protein PtB15_3B436 [Puccinia triticina]|nr:hypothetical protein PtB15_3B436 [Puccinia triticina]